MKKILKSILINIFGLTLISGCNNSSTSTNTSTQNNTNSIKTSSIHSVSEQSSSKSDSSIIDNDKKEIININLNYSENIKYEYFIGEKLDLTNVTINVTYLSGNSQTIDVEENMVTLLDASVNLETDMNSAGYKMVIITYGGYEVSYLIEVIDKDAPIDKITPIIIFDFDAGTEFIIGSDIVPGVSLYPSDLDYEITYSSDLTGYNSEEYPTVAGTYSMVVSIEGNEEYNSKIAWRWFTLVANNDDNNPIEKQTPTITFNYTGGTTFVIGSDKRPTVTVSEGADYEITYSSDSTGYNSSEYPTEPGTYSLVVTVNENDLYTYKKVWLWFKLVSQDKEVPKVTFNYNAGDTFSLSSDERPTVTVSEGADYEITYSSETTGYNSTEYPTEPGDYSLVVTISENEQYNSSIVWLYFKLVQ